MRFRTFVERDQTNESLIDYLAITQNNPWWYALPLAVGAAGYGLYGLGKAAKWGWDRITGKHAEDEKINQRGQFWSRLRHAIDAEGVNGQTVKRLAQDMVQKDPEMAETIKTYMDNVAKEEPANNQLFQKAVAQLQPLVQKYGSDSVFVRGALDKILKHHPGLYGKINQWLQKNHSLGADPLA